MGMENKGEKMQGDEFISFGHVHMELRNPVLSYLRVREPRNGKLRVTVSHGGHIREGGTGELTTGHRT